MDSPVSVVVAEIVMQNIEEQALAAHMQTIPLWLRYVVDTFTTVHKDEIDDFHNHLNKPNADIQFTKEIEENGKLRFLDYWVTWDKNRLRTTITESRHIPTDYWTSHRTTRPLTRLQPYGLVTRRAQLVCNSPDSLQDETDYLN